jgi:hypothetical protein
VLSTDPFVVELPGTYNKFNDGVGYEILNPPSQSTIHSTMTGPYRVMKPNQNASGTDTFTFQWTSPNGTSNHGTVTLVYDDCHTGQLHLDVGPLIGGGNTRFDLTCGYPNENAFLIYSLVGEGYTYVGQINAMIGLRSPIQAGSNRRTDADGFVRWTLPIPDLNPRSVWFQVAQRSKTSNVVKTQLQ